MNPAKARTIIQVAQVVRDMQKTIECYYKFLGYGPWGVHKLEPPLLRESVYRGKPSNHTYLTACMWIGSVHYEIIQPLTGYSIYDEFLEKHGEGFHHVKELVVDCQKAIAEYKAKGIEVIQSGKIGEDEFYYMDTESTMGIVYEIGNNGSVPAPARMYPQN